MTDLDFVSAVIQLIASAAYLAAVILERLPIRKDREP